MPLWIYIMKYLACLLPYWNSNEFIIYDSLTERERERFTWSIRWLEIFSDPFSEGCVFVPVTCYSLYTSPVCRFRWIRADQWVTHSFTSVQVTYSPWNEHCSIIYSSVWTGVVGVFLFGCWQCRRRYQLCLLVNVLYVEHVSWSFCSHLQTYSD